MHVTSGVVGAIVVAKAVQDGLRFELVFVCDYKCGGVRGKKNY